MTPLEIVLTGAVLLLTAAVAAGIAVAVRLLRRLDGPPGLRAVETAAGARIVADNVWTVLAPVLHENGRPPS